MAPRLPVAPGKKVVVVMELQCHPWVEELERPWNQRLVERTALAVVVPWHHRKAVAAVELQHSWVVVVVPSAAAGRRVEPLASLLEEVERYYKRVVAVMLLLLLQVVVVAWMVVVELHCKLEVEVLVPP